MSDSDRPDAGPHDQHPEPQGSASAGTTAGPEEGAGAAVAPSATVEDQVEEQPASRLAPWSPWWRLAGAAVAVGALTWGVTATDASVRLDGEARADSAATTDDGGAGTFVESAVLGCPGPVPWLGDAAEDRPRVEVLAAGAPQPVLDEAPPRDRDDASAATSDPSARDDAAATPGPDAASVTASPDAASVTGSPDAASMTASPDTASSTAEPDDEATTAGAEAQPTPDAASVLRTTGQGGPFLELEHGTPAGIAIEQPASAVVEAAGGMAPGVVGGQVGLGTGSGSRGLTVTGCVPSAELQWLVGGGSAPGRSEQLVLTNPGPDAVTVEVSVWGADGPVSTTGASGIVVPGGGRVVELLDGLAPSADAPVVAVAATGGPVVAHLAESFREGTTDRGTEVVPPVAAPATDLVVPALPTAPEGHERRVVLRVAAPGESQAVVDLTALTADGAVRLTDLVTRVPAGHTLDVELDGLPEGTTALRLRSDEPVTAGARLEVLPAEAEPEVVEDEETTEGAPADDASATATPGTDEPGVTDQGEPLLRAAGDVAWVGATVPSTTPTGMALPDRGVVPDGAAALALSAVDGTTAWVTWVDEAGVETSQTVELPNDSTVLLELPAEARAVWVVAAGPAGVVSAVHLTGADERGPFVASTTVPDLPWQRQVTQVRQVVP